MSCFKTCTSCRREWATRDDFLSDRTVEFVGYQSWLPDPILGLFLFNHDCGTTLAIKAGEFEDLYQGPIYRSSLAGSKECAGYCHSEGETNACALECECAWVGQVGKLASDWPKTS